MNRGFVLFAAALVVAAPPVLAQQVEGVGTPAVEPDPARRAALALDALDVGRLETDRDYAEEMLGHLNVLHGLDQLPPGVRPHVDGLRLLTLASLERPDEVRDVLDQLIGQRPTQASTYILAWFAVLRIGDRERAVNVVEQASRSVRASEWAALREGIEQSVAWQLLREFQQSGEEDPRGRLAESLLRIGWPGNDERAAQDLLRSIVIDRHLARGEPQQAADMLGTVTSPDALLEILLLDKYEPVIGESDRLALFRTRLAQHDAQTAEAYAASPENLRRAQDRIVHLRGIGRDEEALRVAEPFLRDVATTVRSDEQGMWLVNSAAYGLQALGRHQEAVALMDRLLERPIEELPDLIGPAINRLMILQSAGRAEDALRDASRLEADSASFANDYGKMWIASSIVCALAELGRQDEAPPHLNRLRAGREVNGAALTRAYLCLGDLDAAEQVIVERLRGAEPESAVRALQVYEIDHATRDRAHRNFDQLRDRPAVREALERVGRQLRLPLARTYWGDV